ncbi:MAG: non-homologous end-joining DNA ligase, partial [bacterium]
MPGDSLAEYRKKRDFSKTSEPDASVPSAVAGPLRFMVHMHAARAMHYDLRLELDGVMKCWAVPKGPSAATGEKRFATPTEDHPLPYASYEGLIPKGEYGAGPSLIWDAGTFAPDEKITPPFTDRALAEAEFRKGIANGKVGITLRGRKLKGSWALVRMKTNGEWLLLKHKDAASDPAADVLDDDTSVATGFTLDDLRAGAVANTLGTDWSFSPGVVEGARPAAVARVEPMLASATPVPRSGDYIYEPKLDGVRIIAILDHGEVELRSRNGIDVTKAYPGVVAALKQQPATSAVFDGEIVAIDPAGRPSFELLQQRMNLQDATQVAAAERTIPTVFYAFDLLHLDGFDLTRVKLNARREMLARVILPLPQFTQVFAIPASADDAFTIATESGFEGIIAKRAESLYEPGKRSAAWIKRKYSDNDVFRIGGFTAGTGHRGKSFGGLVIGEFVEGKLEYRGKVGSGFTDRDTTAMRQRLEPLIQKASPFSGPTQDDKTATWVKPEIAVKVEYANRTNANLLRAPIFKGLVDPSVVEVRDTPANPPGESPAQTPTISTAAIEEQLLQAKGKALLKEEGWQLAVTNLDKILWPSATGPAHTKRDVLVYAARIWPAIERHIRDRPMTLLRFPNGIHDKKFYQKHWDAELPGY